MSETTYRFELAKTGRAGCQNSACKKNGLKIDKGELRFGTQVMIRDHWTWLWKHWGCVTPAQIMKLQGQVGPLEDLDLDKDLDDILDGYPELSPEAQAKVKFALQHGHVEDADWKGEPELNRPGQKGINKRTPRSSKKKDAGDSDADAGDAETPTKPKAKRIRAKKVKPEERDDEDEDDLALSPGPKKKSTSRKVKKEPDDDDDDLALSPAPKKRSATRRFKKESDDELVQPKKSAGRKRKTPADGDEEGVEAAPKKSRAAKKSTKAVKDESSGTEDAAKPVRKSRGRKVKAELDEYDIPLDTEPDDSDDFDPDELPPKKSKKKGARGAVKNRRKAA